jgi:uncharacterized membrane protein
LVYMVVMVKSTPYPLSFFFLTVVLVYPFLGINIVGRISLGVCCVMNLE